VRPPVGEKLFNSFACKAVQVAKKADESREQFVLLKLALERAAAAQPEEAIVLQNEAEPAFRFEVLDRPDCHHAIRTDLITSMNR